MSPHPPAINNSVVDKENGKEVVSKGDSVEDLDEGQGNNFSFYHFQTFDEFVVEKSRQSHSDYSMMLIKTLMT